MRTHIKTKSITSDQNHPCFGLLARVNKPQSDQRPHNAKKIVHNALFESDCQSCGKCCTASMHVGVEIYPDDLAILTRLQRDSAMDKFKLPLLKFDTESTLSKKACYYLSSSGCNAYNDRPSNCKTYPHGVKTELKNGKLFQSSIIVARCPAIQSIKQKGVSLIHLDDFIFKISDAINSPEKYVDEKNIENFLFLLNEAKLRGEIYYLSKLLGNSFLETIRLCEEGLMTNQNFPTLTMYRDQVYFDLG